MNKISLPLLVAATLTLAGTAAADAPKPALQAQAKVTQQEAEATALTKVPGGRVKESELKHDDGKLIWEVEVAGQNTSQVAKIDVDANSGEIVDVKDEPIRNQARKLHDKTKATAHNLHERHEAHESKEAAEDANEAAQEQK